MNRPAQLALAVGIVISAANQAYGQANSQPVPDPAVTAQNEAWYLDGEPVTYAGNLYYPTGPHIYFNRYEMVRSGFFRGIPLYTRTTIEPFSLVFVPIGGGLMRPYERRREGDIAGTVGSTTPSFPVVVPSGEGAAGTIQAPGPPTGIWRYLVEPPARADTSIGRSAPRPVGTSGTVRPAPTTRPMRSAERPAGLNAAFVDFDGQRYLSSGVPVLLGRNTFERVGEHYGLPVYARHGDRRTIYIPVLRDAELLAPYSLQPQKRKTPDPRNPNPQP